MSQNVFANNAATTLGSSLSSSATTATLATGTGTLFPAIGAGQYFTGTLFAAGSSTGLPCEIVYVTARTGDTITIERGQEGTAPQDWNVGDSFSNYITAAFLNDILEQGALQLQSGNSADDTGTANAGAITLNPAPSSLNSALLLAPIRVLKVSATNTGAYTLNVNGLGSQPVTLNGNPIAAGQLLGNQVFEVFWDGSDFELLSVPAAIQNAELAEMAPETIKGNLTPSEALPGDYTIAQLVTALSAWTPFKGPWVNVTGSRAAGTVYTNSNPFPIMVSCISAGTGATNSSMSAHVGSNIIGVVDTNVGGGAQQATLVFIVPPGATYEITTTGVTIGTWYEL